MEEQADPSEIATDNSDYESFPELINVIIKSYGVRLFNVLLDCFVDDLDLPEKLIGELKKTKALHDELEAAR
jgi:hypothetical protein